MQRDSRAYLEDIAGAAELITEFVAGHDLDDYGTNAMVRAAVERQFEIIGEALTQCARLDPMLVQRIPDYRFYIGFMNILSHQYANLRHPVVWRAATEEVSTLLATIRKLLK